MYQKSRGIKGHKVQRSGSKGYKDQESKCPTCLISSSLQYTRPVFVISRLVMNIAYLRALLRLPLQDCVQLISSFLPMRCVICGESDRPVLIKDGFNTYQFWCISCFVSCLDDDSSPHKSIDTSESSVNDTSGVKDPEDLGSVTDYPSW